MWSAALFAMLQASMPVYAGPVSLDGTAALPNDVLAAGPQSLSSYSAMAENTGVSTLLILDKA